MDQNPLLPGCFPGWYIAVKWLLSLVQEEKRLSLPTEYPMRFYLHAFFKENMSLPGSPSPKHTFLRWRTFIFHTGDINPKYEEHKSHTDIGKAKAVLGIISDVYVFKSPSLVIILYIGAIKITAENI